MCMCVGVCWCVQQARGRSTRDRGCEVSGLHGCGVSSHGAAKGERALKGNKVLRPQIAAIDASLFLRWRELSEARRVCSNMAAGCNGGWIV